MKWYIWHKRCLRYLCLISLAGLACESAPPRPPDDLEALLGFIFEHTADKDPTALSAGITQLAIWFEDETHIKEPVMMS
jgi:hypothetical protein